MSLADSGGLECKTTCQWAIVPGDGGKDHQDKAWGGQWGRHWTEGLHPQGLVQWHIQVPGVFLQRIHEV